MTTRPLAALVAAGLLLAACSGSDEPETTPSATATSLAADDAESPTPAPTGSGSGAPTEAGSTTDPDPTQGPTQVSTETESDPPSQPNPNPGGVEPTPIPAGTFRYATDGWNRLGNGPQEDMPSTTTLVVAAPSAGRQAVTRDLRDSEGYGQAIRRTVQYTDAGFLLHEIRTDAKVQVGLLGDVTDQRTFTASPPGSLGAPDSDVGWTNTFTMNGDGVTLTVTVTLLRFEDVTVGGQTVRAAVVTQHAEFSGELEGSSFSTTWFRPEDLLPLKEDSSSEVTQSGTGVSQTSEYTATLNSLTPS